MPRSSSTTESSRARSRSSPQARHQAYFDIGARRQAHDPSEPVRVLFVGGDFVRKGGEQLLEAFSSASFDRPAELHLVTNHALESRPNNVFVHRGLGPNSPQLLRLFEMADLFVLPSFAECLAVVLMEATAAGLPVITTDVGALAEAVEPEQSGLVLEAGDTRALRASLDLLIGDPMRRQRMGQAGHALAQRKFHAQRNNHALLDLVVQAAAVKHHPEGRMITKFLEAFFRHKLLVLLPPFLIPLIVGPWALMTAPIYYESFAGVWVDKPTYL